MHHFLIVVSNVAMAGICTYISDVITSREWQNGKAVWSLEIPQNTISDLWGNVFLETQRLQILNTSHLALYIFFPWLVWHYSKMFLCQEDFVNLKVCFASVFCLALWGCWPSLFSCLVKCCRWEELRLRQN